MTDDSLARTRRSVVDRGRPDPGARPRRRGRPPPHRNDTTGTGSADPVEVPHHDHASPRRGGRRHRRAAGRRRRLLSSARSQPIVGVPGPSPERPRRRPADALGGARVRPAPDRAPGATGRRTSDASHRWSLRRDRAHPALRRLSGRPAYMDPDRTTADRVLQVRDDAGTDRTRSHLGRTPAPTVRMRSVADEAPLDATVGLDRRMARP